MPVFAGRTAMTITVQGFLRRRRAPDILRAIEDGMVDGARRAIPTVKRFTPVFRGLLKQSWQINFRKNPRRVLVVSSQPRGKVGAMEGGRRAGAKFPPPGPIRNWVRQKLGVPENQVKSVAFLIGRAISRKGIRVHPRRRGFGAMLARTVQRLGADFFGRAVTKRIDRLR